MNEFTLLDLESQFDQVMKITKDWPAEQIIEWLRGFGTVVKVPNPYDDRLYRFSSANGREIGFRFDESNKLILIGAHTTRTK